MNNNRITCCAPASHRATHSLLSMKISCRCSHRASLHHDDTVTPPRHFKFFQFFQNKNRAPQLQNLLTHRHRYSSQAPVAKCHPNIDSTCVADSIARMKK